MGCPVRLQYQSHRLVCTAGTHLWSPLCALGSSSTSSSPPLPSLHFLAFPKKSVISPLSESSPPATLLLSLFPLHHPFQALPICLPPYRHALTSTTSRLVFSSGPLVFDTLVLIPRRPRWSELVPDSLCNTFLTPLLIIGSRSIARIIWRRIDLAVWESTHQLALSRSRILSPHTAIVSGLEVG